MRLILIPFAGGSQYSFTNLANHAVSKGIKSFTVEYPGRGRRFRDPFHDNVDDLVEDVFEQIRHALVPPYAIYGHSMGTIVGYLLARKIMRLNLPKPFHLFFSGCGAPSVRDEEPPKHLLPKKDFIAKLKELGGCPEEILQDEELLNIFEPVIRADFKVIETYRHTVHAPMEIPITVIIGKEDKPTYEDAAAWQLETSKKVEVIEFPGNHFFILGKETEIVDIINRKLRTALYI